MVLVILGVVRLVRAAHRRCSKKVEDGSEQEFLDHLDDIDRSADDSMEMSGLHFHSDYKQCATSTDEKLLSS